MTMQDDRGSSQSEESVWAIVHGCQECHRAWVHVSDPQLRQSQGQAYRMCLDNLFQILEGDLQKLAHGWLSAHEDLAAPAAEDGLHLREEVVAILILNTFTYIAEKLPGLLIEEQSDIRKVLLSLAKQGLVADPNRAG